MTERRSEPSWHARVEEQFHQALELPALERAAFLRTLRAANPELAADVESLLVADEKAGLLPDGEEADGSAAELGQLGDYRLIEQIGEGGMGIVYLAERKTAGFTQVVAVKVLRTGFVDPKLEERFRSERAILARLEHPGIARLIDGGVTPSGQLYYAMERVVGFTLLEHCDRERLSVAARLELFLKICEPVGYAHQQLVIHRDLKPSNIMVTAAGQVKLLDFGVAKLLDADGPGGDATRTNAWVTPSYAAPEQIRGERASTLSDVYALGVILFELLTGQRPYALSSRSPAEVERIIHGSGPAKPSTVVMTGPTEPSAGTSRPGSSRAELSSARGTTPERLRRALSGDLDSVVLKALARDPSQRYGSVGELTEDIRRHLAGRPVSSRPASVAYRFQRFVARNRAAVLVGSLLTASLVGGAIGTWWQAQRAGVQRDLAEVEAANAARVAGLMMDVFRLSDPTETLGDTVTAREILDRSAQRIEQEFTDQPAVQAELLTEVARVYANLGMLATSESLARRTLDIRANHFGENSLAATESLVRLGELSVAQGRDAEGIDLLSRAVQMRQGILDEPDTVLASAQFALGAAVRSQGDHERAQGLMRSSLDARRALLGDDHPAVAEAAFGLAAAFHDGGLLTEAERLFQNLLDERPVERGPHPLTASAALYIGQLHRLRGRFQEADSLLDIAYEMRRKLYDEDHPDIIDAAKEYAAVLERLGRYERAEAVALDGLARAARIYGDRHPDATTLRVVLSQVYEKTGYLGRAMAYHDTVIAHKQTRYGGDHEDLMYAYLRAGETPLLDGDPERALALFEDADAMRLRLNPESDGEPGVPRMLLLSGRARAAELQGRLADARQLHDQAVAMATEVVRPDHRYLTRFRIQRARFWLSQGEAARALPELEAGLEQQTAALPQPHAEIGATLATLGDAQRALGMADWRLTLESARTNVAVLPPSHPLRISVGEAAGG